MFRKAASPNSPIALLTLVNWLTGTLLLVVAVAYPYLDEFFLLQAKKNLAETQVSSIIRAQEGLYAVRERYVEFEPEGQSLRSALEELQLQTLPQDDFLFESFYDQQGTLVVRARVQPRKLLTGELPPLVYEQKIVKQGEEAAGGWRTLSGKSGGLFSFLL